MGRLRRFLLIGAPLIVVAVLVPRKAQAKKPGNHRPSRTSSTRALDVKHQHIQQLVDRIRLELNIPQPVTVAVVEQNKLVVSVTRAEEPARGFELLFEGGFAEQLSPDELEAVVAHELGHVWIFTHHPFLQTEEGANTVALRLVDRKTLEDVYEKVWMRVGGRGLLTYLPTSD